MLRESARGLFLVFLLADDLFAGFLIDDLHRKANLAAIVEAEKFHVNFLTFFHDFLHRARTAIGELRDVHEAIARAEGVDGWSVYRRDTLELMD